MNRLYYGDCLTIMQIRDEIELGKSTFILIRRSIPIARITLSVTKMRPGDRFRPDRRVLRFNGPSMMKEMRAIRRMPRIYD